MMKPLAFLLKAPLPVLPLYYALQAEGMACTVTQPDPLTVQCMPLDLHKGKHPTLMGLYLTPADQLLRIDSFVKGWIACHEQAPLDTDQPLNVSRVPKPANYAGTNGPGKTAGQVPKGIVAKGIY